MGCTFRLAALCPKSNGLAGRKKSCALWLVKKWVVYGAEKIKSCFALENDTLVIALGLTELDISVILNVGGYCTSAWVCDMIYN